MCAKALLSTLVVGVEAAVRSGIDEDEPDCDIAKYMDYEIWKAITKSRFGRVPALGVSLPRS